MKKILFFICVGVITIISTGSINPFKGGARVGSVSFVINNIVYVGLGNDALKNNLNDFWKYDPKIGYWEKIADYPGAPRRDAEAFVIRDRAYVGAGLKADESLDKQVFYRDFYEYNPTNNSWKAASSLRGVGRAKAISYVIDDIAFVGAGYYYDKSQNKNVYLNDFYKYEVDPDYWSEIAKLPVTVKSASSFVLNDIGYVYGGYGSDRYQPVDTASTGLKSLKSIYYNYNMYSYNATTNSWNVKIKDDNTNLSFIDGTSFVYGGLGYMCYGVESPGIKSFSKDGVVIKLGDQLNLKTNNHSAYSSHKLSRLSPISFVLDGKPYFGLGGSVSKISNGVLYDKLHDDIIVFDLQLVNGSSDENSQVSDAVRLLQDYSLNSSGAFTYSLVSGSGDDDNTLFKISGDSLICTAESFDFETKKRYSLRVQSVDKSNELANEKILFYEINDVNEMPTGISISDVTYNEKTPETVVTGILNTLDPDLTDKFKYSFVEGEGGEDNDVFVIVNDSLRFKDLLAVYKTDKLFSIKVQSKDQGGEVFEQILTFKIVKFIPTSMNLNNINNISMFEVFPNPAVYDLEVRYVMTSDNNVKLVLYNSNGTAIKTIVDRYQRKG